MFSFMNPVAVLVFRILVVFTLYSLPYQSPALDFAKDYAVSAMMKAWRNLFGHDRRKRR